MIDHTSSSSEEEAQPSLIDERLPSNRTADALSARLETIVGRLARIRAEVAELRARERRRPS